MKSRRRLIYASLLISGIFFLVGFLISFQTPKIRNWILVNIEKASRESLPVRILPESVEVGFFPIGTTLKNVRILPKDELKGLIEPLSIKRLSIFISPWQLLRGKLRLSEVAVQGTDVTVFVPASSRSDRPPLEGLFDALSLVPVTELNLEDVNAKLYFKNPNLEIGISEIHLSAYKRGEKLGLDVASAALHIRDTDDPTRIIRVDTEASLLADRKSATLTALKLRRGKSFVVASGQVTGHTEALKFTELDLAFRSELRLNSLSRWAGKMIASLEGLPELQGFAALDAKIAKKAHHAAEVDFQIQSEQLKIAQFFIDRIRTSGTLRENTIRLPKLTIENPAGTVTATDFSMDVSNLETVSGTVSTTHLHLHELLKSLGLGEIPVYLQISGELPCEGSVKPKFNLVCKGWTRGENLLVRSDVQSQNLIVAVRNFLAKGEVSVNGDQVAYKADLEMSDSKGRSDGVVNYETGFKINYEADKLALSDITSLAELKLEGAAKLKGSTEGDSHHATLAMNLDTNGVWLEDFWLGNAKARVSYKSGDLKFDDLQSHYSVSRYSGDLKVDLIKNEIFITARSPFFDARDLLKVFSRKVKLPFSVTGTGQAQVKVSGPLQFNALTYDLKSSLFRGAIAGETFDQAHFDVTAKKGEVKTDRVQITKGPASLSLTGTGHPDGSIQTVLKGRGIRLEDSATIATSGFSVSGIVDFDMDMNGPVLGPDTDLRGKLTKTSIGDQGMQDSDFRLKFTSTTIEGGGTFLGDVLKASFTLPIDKRAPFSLKLQSNDWNFAPVFSAIAGPNARKDYVGRLTSSIDISSPSGGFWSATGDIDVSHFSLTRGSLSLTSPEPIAMSMRNGQVRVSKFSLAGDNTYLKVTEHPQPTSKVDLQVNGKMDLSLLALLTPFFEDLRGILSFAFNMKAGPGTTELLGSAYIEKAYLKFFGFPHAFENLRADLLFNQRRVLFNSIKSEFGGGRITASGGMEIKGYKDVPVHVSGTFDKVTLNVPDKIKTTGSGSASFSGTWFPFLLKGEYNVTGGMITKEFGGETSETDGIRRNYFLPDFLLQDNFTPVVMDLKVDFHRGLDIKNELIDGRLLGSLHISGDPAAPSVLGNVTTDKETLINFKDTAFEITSANVQFTDSNEINPRLYIAARSRVQEHDINLLVQGTGSKPDITLTSVPPLPDKDIISLLALGATDTQLNQSIKTNEQQTSSGLQIATGLIKKNPISDAIKSRFGVDVQFSAGFDDAEASVQKVIVSRQFSKKVDLSASQSFGKQRETEVKARYRLNDRLSLIGSWQGREYDETTETVEAEKNPNKVGFDLEYKFEFK